MFYPVVTYFKTEVHSQNSWQDVTLVLSSMSFEFRSAWLILKTIQSKRALYNDLAMEFRTVTAWKKKRKGRLEMIHALHWNVFHFLSNHVQCSYFALAKAFVYYSSLCCIHYWSWSRRVFAVIPALFCSAEPWDVPWTLAWLTLVHSSGWCMRSRNKSHQQWRKEIKTKRVFNFTKMTADLFGEKGRGGGILHSNHPAGWKRVSGQAPPGASGSLKPTQ